MSGAALASSVGRVTTDEQGSPERRRRHLGITAPPVPALVLGEVSHTRYRPVRHAFRYSQFQWLVDVDALPRLPWPARLLARFDAADHFDGGRLGGGIRGDVARFLAARGIRLAPTDQVLMLANARVLGHTFDPLSVFWCLTPSGALVAAVFEVHNTYGGRHAYLLDLDATGRGVVDKSFYVSPFNDTSGALRRAVAPRPRPRDRRRGARPRRPASDGSVHHRNPHPATNRAVLTTTARHLLMTQGVSLLIRWQGIRLWLRRLAVQPRPSTSSRDGVR